MLASFVAFLDGSVVNLALPAIGRELGGGLALQQWVIDGYLLALGALILVAGAVSDQYGRLRVLRAGLGIFAGASLLCAVAPTGWVLVAARCLQGVGAAFLVPSSLAMINSRFSDARQASAIGTWTAWTGTAFVVGPPLGGVLVDALSWRWVFGLNVVPVAVTLYLATKLSSAGAGESGARREARIDGVGAALAAVGLAATVYALIEVQRLGPSNPAVLAGLGSGVACLVAFPWWERRTANPMLPLQLFGERNFAVGNLATVFFYAAVSLGMLSIALFLQEAVGLTATQAGLATLPMPVLSFLLARPFGTLAGRHGPRLYMAAGPVVAAGGFLLMAMSLQQRDTFDFWTQVLPGVLVFGFGLSMTVSPLTAAVLAAVQPAQSGIGSAVNNAVSRIAGLVAVALMGIIVGGAMDFDGFRRTVLVAAVLFAIAGLCSALGISNARHGAGHGSAQSPPRALGWH
ncbi:MULTISPECIES: MFS transporter [unclassified Mycobacterium]|uniref:MFS transporter n=1 Tax=unclassified Mycobacterium TaxID=2642494 RepID=UPI0029C8F8AB|nr:MULTISPECIES: MFS transporter [unclassified Mycobacterium]